MSMTDVFVLPSGVECEVQEMTGKDQRILTEQTNKPFSERLNEVLANVIVRIGTSTTITLDVVNKLLAEDRKCALWKARMFSVGEDVFLFKWKYIDADSKQQELEMSVDLTDMEDIKPYYKQWTELSEIEADKKISVTLPRSGKVVEFTLLDGVGESSASKMKKSDLSSHTPIKMRRPVEYVLTGDDKKTRTPIQLDLDRLSLVDIEALRKAITEAEGKFHTELRFEHPEAENKQTSEKYVVTDLLAEMAFFFPSGQI